MGGEALRKAVAATVAVVALGALVAGAAGGGRSVEDQRGATAVARAVLDDAYYGCIATQAHSLVSDRRPVLFEGPDFGAYIALIKAVGSWVTVASHPSRGAVALSLNVRRGPGACLGRVVVAYERGAGGRVRTVVGTGASVAGRWPPPAEPPLTRTGR